MESFIKINDQQYLLKNDDIFALTRFEEITGKNVFKMQEYNLSDTITLFYCILSECNTNFNHSFAEFKEMVRKDKTILEKYFEFIGKNIVENKIKKK